ncbi:ABC transporter permease [Bacterioplanoides sp.]|uniref:ABC transporter permease n=1 Tax=Bacterioplanoides sp. TaxID=2066072 RepID=UPI003B001773
MFWRVAFFSLLHRKGSAVLTLLAVAISVFSVTAVEHLRHQAKAGFAQTVSGVDLIVGARGGDINLLLYSVFYIGNASRNISYQSFEKIRDAREVKWAIPLSMGDSHRGFRVVGTHADLFKHFRYGQKQSLTFTAGQPFNNAHSVVLGAAVAQKLNYQLDDQITIAHGLGRQSFQQHDQYPFSVVGILKTTGTPVDQAIYVSLAGLEAVHKPGVTHDQADSLRPESITATLVGLKSRLKTFQLQRQINQSEPEPLMAILPGVSLSQLWESMNIMENTLRIIAWLILAAALMGLSASLLASMRERQKELLVLRTLGASPWFIFSLIQAETLLITATAIAIALLGFTLALNGTQELIVGYFGIRIDPDFVTAEVVKTLGIIVVASLLVSLYPGYKAYRLSLG